MKYAVEILFNVVSFCCNTIIRRQLTERKKHRAQTKPTMKSHLAWIMDKGCCCVVKRLSVGHETCMNVTLIVMGNKQENAKHLLGIPISHIHTHTHFECKIGVPIHIIDIMICVRESTPVLWTAVRLTELEPEGERQKEQRIIDQ